MCTRMGGGMDGCNDRIAWLTHLHFHSDDFAWIKWTKEGQTPLRKRNTTTRFYCHENTNKKSKKNCCHTQPRTGVPIPLTIHILSHQYTSLPTSTSIFFPSTFFPFFIPTNHLKLIRWLWWWGWGWEGKWWWWWGWERKWWWWKRGMGTPVRGGGVLYYAVIERRGHWHPAPLVEWWWRRHLWRRLLLSFLLSPPLLSGPLFLIF